MFFDALVSVVIVDGFAVKELSKITMPVIFNEPLSLLQRVTEYLEYGNLLRTAAQTDDPLLRMQVWRWDTSF